MIIAEQGLRLLIGALDQLQIPYLIGGSLASSQYGSFRFTNDIDVVVKIDLSHVAPLVQMLKADFYADEEMIRSAVLHGRSFNVIHFNSTYKFDLFPMKRDAFQESQMLRRRLVSLAKLKIQGSAQMATAEDTVLSKLVWYRETNSAQQWSDLRAVVSGQREFLDREYLDRWAAYLGVEKLLAELLA